MLLTTLLTAMAEEQELENYREAGEAFGEGIAYIVGAIILFYIVKKAFED